MKHRSKLIAVSKLAYFCVAAGLVLGFVSRADAGGSCPAIEESSTPPGSCTWYVQSGAPSSTDGGYLFPFNNLAQVQAASNPGDTIIIVSVPTSEGPLDGGIALQAGQTLAGGNAAGVPGVGPCSNVIQASPAPALLFTLPSYPVITSLPTTVPTSSGASNLPWITNTSSTGNTGTGDAVELAANTTVENLVIGGVNNPVYRGGIYGLNVNGSAKITCNDISYFNNSGTVGFIVQPFYHNTWTPGVATHSSGINGGWAGVMIDSSNVRTSATISNNYVHNGLCGDVIDIRNVNAPATSSAAYIQAIVTGNYVYANQQCTKVSTMEGIGTQTEVGTSGTVLAVLTNNVENLHGQVETTTGPTIGSAGANADSLFVNPAGNGSLSEKIINNLFLNGKGGSSTNGMEYIIGDGTNTSVVEVVNSVFQADPGDMLELYNRGNGGGSVGTYATLILENVVVQKTSISGGLAAYADPPGGVGGVGLPSEPDNTGECLGVASVGAGDITVFEMINSTFTGCDNNGIEVTNNFATGDGPPTGYPQTIVLDITNSRVSGSRFYNLWLNNVSPLPYLNVKVQNSDLSGSLSGVGVGFDSQFGYAVQNAVIDLGGGSLGSTGNNCFYPNSFIYDLEATTTTTLTYTSPPPPTEQPPGPQYTPVIYANNDYWGGGVPTMGTGTTNVPGFQVFTTQPGPYARIDATNPLLSVPNCGPGPGEGPGPQQLGLD